MFVLKKPRVDQCLSNCLPTPPLTKQQSIYGVFLERLCTLIVVLQVFINFPQRHHPCCNAIECQGRKYLQLQFKTQLSKSLISFFQFRPNLPNELLFRKFEFSFVFPSLCSIFGFGNNSFKIENKTLKCDKDKER